MTAVEDTRAYVFRLAKADPGLSAQQMADIIGVSRQRVHRILKEAGWRQGWSQGPEPEKPKKRGKA